MRSVQPYSWFLRHLRRRIHDHIAGKEPTGISYNPYDRALLERRAKTLADHLDNKQPLGSLERGRYLLRLIENSFPIDALKNEYFANLHIILQSAPILTDRGQLLLGLGTGRCGSTTLTHLLSHCEGALITHENPPMIFWEPEQEQIQFHLQRFYLLTQYFPLVGDFSHWWINVFDKILLQFPNLKVIGAIRDTQECAKSFMRIKGFGPRSLNHWAPYGNGLWLKDPWDPSYPTYELLKEIASPDTIKYGLIRHFIQDYNENLKGLAARLPQQVLLIRTEKLSDPKLQSEIFDFLRLRGQVSLIKLNTRNVSDGVRDAFLF